MQAVIMSQSMENTMNSIRNQKPRTIVKKYEAMEAFFRTESEENDDMAIQLNDLICHFYEQEQICKRNVTELSVDSDTYKKVIEYIEKSEYK